MARYSLSDLANLHREGRISDRKYRKAGGRVCGPHEIDDPEYQRDAGPGFGKTTEWGPDDAGHIDARANRRMYPRETTMRASNRPSGRSSRAAAIQPTGNMYDVPGRN